jgi:hypothetical protein
VSSVRRFVPVFSVPAIEIDALAPSARSSVVPEVSSPTLALTVPTLRDVALASCTRPVSPATVEIALEAWFNR